jgi:tetratricopeptide (TPR) repeat protein
VGAAIAFGLGLGVHHVTVALTFPALAVLVLGTRPRPSWRVLVVPGLTVLLVTGLLYATLPLLASRDPVLNWGDPTSLQRLFWHVSGRQYSAFVSLGENLGPELRASLGRVAREFGVLPLVPALGVWGFACLWRRDKTAFTALAALIATNLAFTSLYTIAEDKDAYQLPVFLGLAVVAGIGAAELRGRLPPRLFVPGAAALLALPLIPLLSNSEARDRSGFRVAADYADNALRTMPPDGLILTSEWQLYSPLLYFQEAEGRRRDVVVVDVSLVRRSWYLEFLERRFPVLMGPVQPEARAFLEDLRGWEEDPGLYDRDLALNKRINERFLAFMRSLVEAQLRRGRAFATSEVVIPKASPDPPLATLVLQSWTLRPRGILFELSSVKGFTPLEPLDLETRGLGKRALEIDDVVATKVRPAYLNMLLNRGRYLAAAKDPAGAREAFERALSIDPDFEAARQGMATLPSS